MLNLAMSISQLGLRPRTLRMLATANITSASDLVAYTEAELRSHKLDDRAILDINENLEMHALRLHVGAAVLAAPKLFVVPNEPALERKKNVLTVDPDPMERASSDGPQDLLDGIVDGADLEELKEAFAGIELRTKRASKKTTLTDERRADAFSAKFSQKAHRKAERPSRNDPRVAELRDTMTLTVDEVAFLYSVSRDAIYDAVNRPGDGSIPHTRLGRRVIIATRHVFAALGLD
jgi:hypothetical protein